MERGLDRHDLDMGWRMGRAARGKEEHGRRYGAGGRWPARGGRVPGQSKGVARRFSSAHQQPVPPSGVLSYEMQVLA